MELAADSIVTLVGLVVLGATLWAVRSHFASEEMLPRAKLISTFVIFNMFLLVYLTWTLVQPVVAQIIGALIMIGSAWLFFAAIKASKEAQLRFAFDPEKPHSLLDSGPYALVRHPFYVSYIMLWLGWALAAWSLWTLPIFVILLVLYINAAQMEERNFAGTPMADDHVAYKRRVGFFWPNIFTLWQKNRLDP